MGDCLLLRTNRAAKAIPAFTYKLSPETFNSDYTQVAYCESFGLENQYIDLDYIGNQNTGFEMKVMPKNDMGVANFGNIFGAKYAENSQGIAVSTYGESGKGYLLYGNNNYVPELTKNVFQTISLKNGIFTFPDRDQITISAADFNTGCSLNIFALNFNGTRENSASCRMYYFKLYDGSKLIKHLVPCRHNSDNAVGMYDILNHVFYPSQGPNFEAGPDLNVASGYHDAAYEIFDDGDKNWRIKFYSSGVLEFIQTNGARRGIDAFLVGGGAGMALHTYMTYYANPPWGPRYGGGGGYTDTFIGIEVLRHTPYTIIVGKGGRANAYTSQSRRYGSDGESTSAFGHTVSGGIGAYARSYRDGNNTERYEAKAGDGGSGGSGAVNYVGYDYQDSATDGSDGTSGSSGFKPGIGQRTTTREFGEPNGDLYASGGGEGTNILPNTGDGGFAIESGYNDVIYTTEGSTLSNNDSYAVKNVHGASGIVVIRNHDILKTYPKVNILESVSWEQGAINSATGKTYAQSKSNSNYRIRTSTILKVSPNKPCHLNFNTDIYRVNLLAFDSASLSVNGLAYTDIWINSAADFIPLYPYIAISLKREDDEAITPTVYTDIVLTQDIVL